MGKIIKLDQHLTNMISAGEVVERPSGIVKELIENAIDAQADAIDVTIREGGISYLQVKDNGCGMDAADATMAFERHATSKIRTEEELFSIRTMGFRGEALPSIASVSQVEMITNDKKESTQVRIEYGKLVFARPYYGDEGTCITVENLFQKTPARLKHLKTRQYEASLVASIVEKYALGHPEIAFHLVSDGKQQLSFNGNNNLKEVMSRLYGTSVSNSIVAFEGKDYDFRIHGAYVLPNITRAGNNYITLFINGRLIRNYRLSKVVVEAFSDYLFNDRYPIVVLNMETDAQLVDVNVHPTKREIRLSKSAQMEDLIRKTLSESLRVSMAAPQIEKVARPERENVEFASWNLDALYPDPSPSAKPEERKEEYAIEEEKQEILTPREERVRENLFPDLRLIGQLQNKYLLCEGEDGLYIIDQHAAQERYNYERFQKKLEEAESDYQPLLLPFVHEVSPSLLENFEQLRIMFEKVGLEVELFGSNSIVCRQVPLWMKDVDLSIYFSDLIDLFAEDKKPSLLEVRDHALESLACHASVKFNTRLTTAEMTQILENLKSCRNPFKCPHGRPTFLHLSSQQLIKEFLR